MKLQEFEKETDVRKMVKYNYEPGGKKTRKINYNYKNIFKCTSLDIGILF